MREALGTLGIRWRPGADRAQTPSIVQAEQAARLTGDSQLLEAARQATDEALAGQPLESSLDAQLLVNLRAAVQYWRKEGHLNVKKSHPENVQGQEVPLGRWLPSIRPKPGQAPRLRVDWARRLLDVLGMEWETGRGAGVPAHLVGLAALVREEDNARRDGHNAADTARQHSLNLVQARLLAADVPSSAWQAPPFVATAVTFRRDGPERIWRGGNTRHCSGVGTESFSRRCHRAWRKCQVR